MQNMCRTPEEMWNDCDPFIILLDQVTDGFSDCVDNVSASRIKIVPKYSYLSTEEERTYL